jgi:hypothetical protein
VQLKWNQVLSVLWTVLYVLAAELTDSDPQLVLYVHVIHIQNIANCSKVL